MTHKIPNKSDVILIRNRKNSLQWKTKCMNSIDKINICLCNYDVLVHIHIHKYLIVCAIAKTVEYEIHFNAMS